MKTGSGLLLLWINLLVALSGAVGGCSKSEYLNDARKELGDGEWARALRFANAAVKQHPEDPKTHLVRAMALAELGVRKPINERKTYYETLKKTLDKADSLAQAGDRAGTLEEIKLERINSWVREYNAGIRILSSKEGVSNEQAVQATNHFSHALVIMPDSVVAFVMLARVHGILNDYVKSTDYLSQASEADPTLKNRFKMDYALMLSKSGNYIDALPLYEDLFASKPDDFAIATGLYNTYQKMGLFSAAQSIMDKLFELNPSDEKLKFNQGVRSYYELEEKLQATIRRVKREAVPDQTLFATTYVEVEEQIQKLEFLFTDVANKEKEKPVFQYTPGLFYFNLGILYGELATHFTDRELRLKFLDVRNELYKRAIPYLKLSFGAVNDDKEVWNILYQVYTALGMKTEAETALRNVSS